MPAIKSKNWFESRTVWVNAITLAIGLAGVVAGSEVLPPDAVVILTSLIVPVLNILLRFLTDKPITGVVPVLMLLAVMVSAQGLDAAESSPAGASYRINTSEGFGGSSTGIADRLVVTNAHVATNLGGKVRLSRPLSGVGSITGTVIARDREADLALVYTDSEVSWVPVNRAGIDGSKPLVKYGYGMSNVLVRINSRLLDRNGMFTGGRWARLSTPAVSGDSGGGVFQDDKLVAVVWGSSDPSGRSVNGHSMSVEANYLHRFIQQADKQRGNHQLEQAVFGCGPCQPIQPHGNYGGGGGGLPYREPVQPDLQPKPIEPKPQEPTPAAPDIDDIVAAVIAKLPKPQDGIPGKDGLDGAAGRGIDSISIDKGKLVVKYSDGKTQTFPGFGITFEMADESGRRVDSEFIPLGGKLTLQQYIETP